MAHDMVALIRSSLELDEPIAEDTPLISTGVIDSFDIVTLLTVFETSYGVALSPGDLDVAEFDTPAQMRQRVERARS